MGDPEPLPTQAVLERIRRLGSRAGREVAGRHYVEGFRSVLAAFSAGIPIDILVQSEILCGNPLVRKLVRRKKREGVPLLRVTPGQFRSVSTTARASGIGAIVHQHWTPLHRLDPRRGLSWIALRRLRSPGNLGTIVRTAEAVGAGGIIFLGDGADPFDPAVVRASMGGIFRIQLARAGIELFEAWVRRHGCTVIGASPAGSTAYTDVPVDPPLVVLLGEERVGLSPRETAVATHLARIPMVGTADSLNVGVAAGVMLYEVLRRRGPDPLTRAPSSRECP